MTEKPEEFRARIRSIGVIKGSRTKPLEKVITRAGGVDAGQKAKVVINEDRDIVLTTSDNRQDVHIIGKAASIGAGRGAR